MNFNSSFDSGPSPSQLEPEYAEPFNAWKAAPSPASNASMLKTIQPVLDRGISMHVGASNPLLQSRARQIGLTSLRSYDPARSRLATHITNNLQGLKRIAAQQSNPVRVPERIAFDRHHLENYTQELTDELGREPTDYELTNRTGFSAKRLARVRSYHPGVAEGTLEDIDPSLVEHGMSPASRSGRDAWTGLVYDDLATIDKQILEMTLGMNGRKPATNLEIARKLRRSPGAISQRKASIQKLLDQEADLSPFLG